MNGKSKIVYIFNESHYLGNLHFTASLKTLLFSGFIVCVNVGLSLSLSLSLFPSLRSLLSGKGEARECRDDQAFCDWAAEGFVCLGYFQGSSSVLYQRLTSPLTTHHFPALPTHWWFCHTKPSPCSTKQAVLVVLVLWVRHSYLLESRQRRSKGEWGSLTLERSFLLMLLEE